VGHLFTSSVLGLFNKIFTHQKNVGDGSNFFFGHDLGNGENTSKERNPDIFLIARDREARVVEYIEFRNYHLYWNPLFIRALHDQEVESMAQLLDIMK
jgi:hypothetical protein